MTLTGFEALARVDSTGGPGDGLFGVLLCHTAHIALPLAVLREVVPCPEHLDPLPDDVPGVLGAFELRGEIVPVLDLAAGRGAATPRHPGQVIVVLVHEGGRLGLLCERVIGVSRVEPDDLHPVSRGAGTLSAVSHTFLLSPGRQVVSALDVEAMTALPGVVTITTGAHSAGPDAAAQGAGPAGLHSLVPRQGGSSSGRPTADQRSLLLLRCGATRLAIDITAVHSTLPQLPVHDSPLSHGFCRGVVHHTGIEIPVVDPVDLLGLEGAGEQLVDVDHAQGVVFRLPQGLVGLLVSEVVNIIALDPSALVPVPAFALRRPDLFEGAVDLGAAGLHLVIAPERLLAHPDLQALAGLNDAGDARTSRQGGAQTRRHDDAEDRWAGPGADAAGTIYLTFVLGGDLATPLEQVREILPFPEHLAGGQASDGGVLGLTTLRGQVMPVVCLASVLGRLDDRPEAAAASVLVVDSPHGPVGFAVGALRAIERSVWEEIGDAPAAGAGGSLALAGATPDALRTALAARRTVRTTPVETADGARMVTRLDLAPVAEALTRPAGG